MRTKAQCHRYWDQIHYHLCNHAKPDSDCKLPDIGSHFIELLEYSTKAPPEEARAYKTLLAFYVSDDWRWDKRTEQEKRTLLLRRTGTLALQRMHLVDGKCRLSVLGHHYLKYFVRERERHGDNTKSQESP